MRPSPRPADLGFTEGAGWTGRIIRHGTGGPAHVLLFIRLILAVGPWELWLTHEAFGGKGPDGTGSGLRARLRWLHSEPVQLVTVARDDTEAIGIVLASCDLVATQRGYDWVQIARIAVRFCERLTRALWVLPLASALEALHTRLQRLSPAMRGICSGWVWEAVLRVRPELSELTPYGPSEIWPDELERVTQLVARAQWEAGCVGPTRDRVNTILRRSEHPALRPPTPRARLAGAEGLAQ